MAYKPSPPDLTQEPFASMQRVAEESERVLADADIVGRSEAEARRRVEASGLHFRPSHAGEVMSLDLSLTRVTATIVDGRVREACIG